VLLKENITVMQEGFATDQLPQTIIDAVQTTRELGLSYLWVDALCIIQDDQENQLQEISSMHEIYSQAYVTIAAGASRGVYQGFHNTCANINKDDDKSSGQICYPCVVDNAMTTIDVTSVPHYDFPSRSADLSLGPLNDRGWTLQESLLSPQVLTFAFKQTFWRCMEGLVILGDCARLYCGINQGGDCLEERVDWWSPPTSLHKRWCGTVTDYTKRSSKQQPD
jgi:Heterokaryon incompatibility protein (HET)